MSDIRCGFVRKVLVDRCAWGTVILSVFYDLGFLFFKGSHFTAKLNYSIERPLSL